MLIVHIVPSLYLFGGLYGLRFNLQEEDCPLVAPRHGVFKFNLDGAARGKPGPAIDGVLRDDRGVMLCMFSKGIGIRGGGPHHLGSFENFLQILRGEIDCGE